MSRTVGGRGSVMGPPALMGVFLRSLGDAAVWPAGEPLG